MSHYVIKLPHREAPNRYVGQTPRENGTGFVSIMVPQDEARRFETETGATAFASQFWIPGAFIIEPLPDLMDTEKAAP